VIAPQREYGNYARTSGPIALLHEIRICVSGLEDVVFADYNIENDWLLGPGIWRGFSMHFSGGSDAVMRKQTVWDPCTVSCCHLKSRSDGST